MRSRFFELLLSLIVLAAALPAAAQTPLFSPSTTAEVTVAPSVARSVEAVDVSRLAVERASERLSLAVTGRSLVAVKTGFAETPDHITWTGKLEGEPGSLVVLTTRGERTAGVILAGDRSWQLVPQPGGGHALAEIELADFPGCGLRGATGATAAVGDSAADPAAGGATAASLAGVSAAAGASGTVRVLELYTAEMERQAGGRDNAELLIANSVDLANTLFADSGIGARLELAGTARWGGGESGDLDADLESLRHAPEVADLRRQHRADLVGVFEGENKQFCGVGSLYNGGPSFGFHVVTWSCATANLSYPHEVGHNFSAHHNPENAFGSAPAQARGHYVCSHFRTVMGYPDPCPDFTPRVAYFSTPSRQYQGQPVGIAGQRDNVSAINASSPKVALFAEALYGDQSACTAGDTTLCLQGGRFEVSVTWNDEAGATHDARAVPMSREAGYFWFFRKDNVEVLTKVIDGCAANHAYWTFLTGMTNLGMKVNVRDTQSGLVRSYSSTKGQSFRPIQDTGAFPVCG